MVTTIDEMDTYISRREVFSAVCDGRDWNCT